MDDYYRCFCCGSPLRERQNVREIYVYFGRSEYQPFTDWVCPNHQCPESPNFKDYLMGKYTPPLGKFYASNGLEFNAMLNTHGKYVFKKLGFDSFGFGETE